MYTVYTVQCVYIVHTKLEQNKKCCPIFPMLIINNYPAIYTLNLKKPYFLNLKKWTLFYFFIPLHFHSIKNH